MCVSQSEELCVVFCCAVLFSLIELTTHIVMPAIVRIIPATALLPPNSSPSSLPVRRVKMKVRELATGTAKDISVVARVK